jgi:hypothetical protein
LRAVCQTDCSVPSRRSEYQYNQSIPEEITA